MEPQNLTQAATAPNVQGALQQLLLSRINTPAQSKQLDENRQGALQGLQSSLQQPAMGNYTPTEHAAYTWIKNMAKNPGFGAVAAGIGAGGEMLRDQEIAENSGRIAAAKVGYEDAKDLTKLDAAELLAMRGVAAGGKGVGKYIHFKDDKDNVYIMNNSTGEREIIPSSQSKLWGKAYLEAYQQATANRMENPEDYAVEFANNSIKMSPGAVASPETVQPPTVPVVGGNPKTAPSNVSPEAPIAAKPSVVFKAPFAKGADSVADLNFQGKTLPEVEAMVNSVTDPEARAKAQEALAAMKSQAPSAPQASTDPNKPRNLAYKDLRSTAREESLGKAEGPEFLKERNDLGQLFSANAKLVSQLNMLEHLYKNPDIPQGALAPQLQALRSGLKTLGIHVNENVGLGQMAEAISTGLALSMKNADGKNLLPGAMSNYEDQLLRNMVPGLQQTQQGRMALIQMMREMAGSNMRIAQEAEKHAQENGEQLTPAWNRRKERVMLEEMARMKDVSKRIIAQYGRK